MADWSAGGPGLGASDESRQSRLVHPGLHRGFRWNDADRELTRALALAQRHGLTLWFEFVRTWGRSKRKREELTHLLPHLKPGTSLPPD